jgi:transposase-like protein
MPLKGAFISPIERSLQLALSDIEKEKDKKRNVNRAVSADTNLRWSDKQKLEAVQSWLVLGNMSLVSRLHGIPRITLQVWKASAWWKELVDELKLQDRIELSNKMKSIVNAAHAVVANRLENGDPVLNQKTGEIVMKPVAMKDAHRVAVDLLNQREAIEKATQGPVEQEHNSDKLEALAERFAEFATKSIEKKLDNKRTVEVTDVVFVDQHSDSPAVGAQGMSGGGGASDIVWRESPAETSESLDPDNEGAGRNLQAS